ncbi:hypothetical protein H8S90_24285 [Olivibacter sp. SDN3]|uniref:hypothetical protein n=1 Tax=Olivibacter sp. SDN3 TaxID=2764720 RepID=UPI001651A7CD|nr:hypothetical protein [Olivibacter sp. SDN3]QNL49787.1 hypothetical protein H8S90_24285 [Olivibacter sp. SDN3]
MTTFLLGSGIAGATEIVNHFTSSTQQQYSWQQVDRQGNNIGLPFNDTVSGAQSRTGCSGDEETCATGTSGTLPPVTIQYND